MSRLRHGFFAGVSLLAGVSPGQPRFPRKGTAGRRRHAAAGPAADRARLLSAGACWAATAAFGRAVRSGLRITRWFSPGRPPCVAATIPCLSAAGEVRRARRLRASTAVYEKAARNLGASEWRVFWRVTLPLARRSIFAAGVLAFARSLGDFGATLMVAGNIPQPHADRRGGHLRRRGIGQHDAGARAGAGDLGGRDC